jgi:hypothetical protein
VEWSELFLVAEAQGQFENPEEGERLPVGAITEEMVNTQQAEKT